MLRARIEEERSRQFEPREEDASGFERRTCYQPSNRRGGREGSARTQTESFDDGTYLDDSVSSSVGVSQRIGRIDSYSLVDPLSDEAKRGVSARSGETRSRPRCFDASFFPSTENSQLRLRGSCCRKPHSTSSRRKRWFR